MEQPQWQDAMHETVHIERWQVVNCLMMTEVSSGLVGGGLLWAVQCSPPKVQGVLTWKIVEHHT
jgi:hypothetical protein